MTPLDIRTLENALTEVASFFGRKAPTELAIKVWLRKCKALPIDCVVQALEDWMASAKSMPTIDEIVVKATDLWAVRRRREEEARQAQVPTGRGVPMPPETAAQIVALFERMREAPRLTARQNALNQRNRHWRGEYVPPHFLSWAMAELGDEFFVREAA